MKKIILLTILQFTILMAGSFVMTKGNPLIKTDTNVPTDIPVTEGEYTPQILPPSNEWIDVTTQPNITCNGTHDDTAGFKSMATDTSVTNWYIPADKNCLIVDITPRNHLRAIHGGGTITSKANRVAASGGRTTAYGALWLDEDIDGLVIDSITFLTENSTAWPAQTAVSGSSGEAWKWYGHITLRGEANLNNIEIRNSIFDEEHFKFNAIAGNPGINTNKVHRNIKIANNTFKNFAEFAIEILAVNPSRVATARIFLGAHIHNNFFDGSGSSKSRAISLPLIYAGAGIDGKRDGTENNIYNNIFTDCDWGIESTESSGLYIHHNKMTGMRGKSLQAGNEDYVSGAEGRNYIYNNHIEAIPDTSSNIRAYIQISSRDEIYNNYFKSNFRLGPYPDGNGVLSPRVNGMDFHDNTIVGIGTSGYQYPEAIKINYITEARFTKNEVYTNDKTSRGFRAGSGAGGSGLNFTNNKIRLGGAYTGYIDSFTSSTVITGLDGSNHNTDLPTGRTGAGLTVPMSEIGAR